MPVFNLPSENVPAPPSPNWMFVRLSRGAPALKASTMATRPSTSAPRSTTSGARPARARYRAQNSPAGPVPTTMGRISPPTTAGTAKGGVGSKGRTVTPFAGEGTAPSARAAATVTTPCTFAFLRASMERFSSRTSPRTVAFTPRARATSLRKSPLFPGSSASRETGMFDAWIIAYLPSRNRAVALFPASSPEAQAQCRL